MKISKIFVLAIAAITIFTSCRKEEAATITPAADDKALQQSKKWFNEQVDAKAFDMELKPDWKQYKTITNSKGQQVLSVPLHRSNGQYLELNVVLIGDAAFGAIKSYTMQADSKTRLTVYAANGGIIKEGIMSKKGAKPIKAGNEILEDGITEPWEFELDEVEITYVPGNPSNDPSGYGNPWDSYDPSIPTGPVNDYDYGGGYGGSNETPEPAPVQDITNEVSDPCLREVVEDLKSSDMAGIIAQIIKNLDNNRTVQVKMVDVHDTQNHKPANSLSGMIGNTFKSDITLSKAALLTGTKEYAACVIIHEVVHAYMKYMGQSSYLDQTIVHQTMADQYVKPMAEYLSEMYSMPAKNATALAWSGLNDANSYANSNTFSYPGGTMTKAELGSIYADYVTQYAGKPVCD